MYNQLSDKEIEKILADDQRFEDFFALLDVSVVDGATRRFLIRVRFSV